MRSLFSCVAILLLFGAPTRADLLISQYYEGASNNKWIELYNNGPLNIDLSTISASLWTNANAEGYKTNGTPSQSLTLSGILSPGSTFLLSHPSAALPSYAVPAAIQSSLIINFNGNDSFSISPVGTFSTASMLDAIGFTNAGNEGADKSYARISTAAGFDTVAGSEAADFPTVWQLFTNAAVDGAATGTNERLGFSTLAFTAVPEPGAVLFGGLACGVIGLAIGGRRLKNKLFVRG